MDGYLLDTSAISAILDPGNKHHSAVQATIDGIEVGAPRYVPCIALAELKFGQLLDEMATGHQSPKLIEILKQVQKYPIRDITRHTAVEYAELKTKLAAHYLDLKARRPKYVEDWADRVTGKTLQVGENDLWICALARECNLILITTDEKMADRITPADPTIQIKRVK